VRSRHLDLKLPKIPSSEITSESVYLRRRDFIKAGSLLVASGLTAGGSVSAVSSVAGGEARSPEAWALGPNDALTPYDDVTSYNNFYEFGMDKSDPARYAHELTLSPWQVQVDGEVVQPRTVNLEDILAAMQEEQRIYRLRCVEAWSMVIPWDGFSLAELIRWLKPTSKAKYVYFETAYRREEMRGTRSFSSVIDWPYREGLRLDEAMNPLAFMATGVFGKALPAQNGAPLRLVVPWKYGFKSIKSIVRIRFTETQPKTSWQGIAPHEYGFYANVNPDVDHPRWSQRYERRLPSSLWNPNRIPTQLFNGYGEFVADLYKGMNLARYY